MQALTLSQQTTSAGFPEYLLLPHTLWCHLHVVWLLRSFVAYADDVAHEAITFSACQLQSAVCVPTSYGRVLKTKLPDDVLRITSGELMNNSTPKKLQRLLERRPKVYSYLLHDLVTFTVPCH